MLPDFLDFFLKSHYIKIICFNYICCLVLIIKKQKKPHSIMMKVTQIECTQIKQTHTSSTRSDKRQCRLVIEHSHK